MNLVFFIFNDNLLEHTHLLTLFNSALITISLHVDLYYNKLWYHQHTLVCQKYTHFGQVINI